VVSDDPFFLSILSRFFFLPPRPHLPLSFSSDQKLCLSEIFPLERAIGNSCNLTHDSPPFLRGFCVSFLFLVTWADTRSLELKSLITVSLPSLVAPGSIDSVFPRLKESFALPFLFSFGCCFQIFSLVRPSRFPFFFTQFSHQFPRYCSTRVSPPSQESYLVGTDSRSRVSNVPPFPKLACSHRPRGALPILICFPHLRVPFPDPKKEFFVVSRKDTVPMGTL